MRFSWYTGPSFGLCTVAPILALTLATPILAAPMPAAAQSREDAPQPPSETGEDAPTDDPNWSLDTAFEGETESEDTASDRGDGQEEPELIDDVDQIVPPGPTPPPRVPQPTEEPAEPSGRPDWCTWDWNPEEDPDRSHDPALCAEPRGFFGGPRWFLQGRIDLGFLFLQPGFVGGYGTPHETFIGLEANPLVSGQGVGLYTGVRGSIPYGDLRVGARFFQAFTRSFLRPFTNFDHLQIRDRTGPTANYISLEAQLEFAIPLGEMFDIRSETTGTYVTFASDDSFPLLFEETLRVIVKPPFVWSTSLGLRIRFGDDNVFYIEPAAELVHLVERNDFVLRIGLHAGVNMWPDLELRLIAMPAILSPDSLGAAAAHTFLLGVRYRWATDNPSR